MCEATSNIPKQKDIQVTILDVSKQESRDKHFKDLPIIGKLPDSQDSGADQTGLYGAEPVSEKDL